MRLCMFRFTVDWNSRSTSRYGRVPSFNAPVLNGHPPDHVAVALFEGAGAVADVRGGDLLRRAEVEFGGERRHGQAQEVRHQLPVAVGEFVDSRRCPSAPM